MFKKAVDTHNASQTKQSLKSQLFPSSSPDAPRDVYAPFKPPTMTKARPLSTSSGNIGKFPALGSSQEIHNSGKSAAASSKGIKRTSSGLAKALDRSFDDFDISHVNSQSNPIVIEDKVESKQKNSDVYFDENDFDSDIDLEVEDPTAKGTIEYPKPAPSHQQASHSQPRPPSRKSSVVDDPAVSTRSFSERANSTDSAYFSASSVSAARGAGPNFKPTLPAALSHSVGHWVQPSEHENIPQIGQFRPQMTRQSVSDSPPLPSSSSDPFPWSSSPAEHTTSISAVRKAEKAKQIRDFAFTKPQLEEKHSAPPRKRRRLPWADATNESNPKESPEKAKPAFNVPKAPSDLSKTSSSVAAPVVTATPRSKSTGKSTLPWNATPSAVKEQQKALKQASKKLVKSNEATDESFKEAVAKKRKTNISRIFLSEEQQHVLNLVVEQRKSVFFTGSAGMHLRHALTFETQR
jgi:ATP-dependent DNA helicase PIF1